MKYGYIRVSSKSQKDNYSIQEQRDLVLAAGADEVIEEIYTGGKVYERPRFEALIKRLQAGDTLIVCKLDRFARTVVEGAMLAQELYDKNISLNILNMCFTSELRGISIIKTAPCLISDALHIIKHRLSMH